MRALWRHRQARRGLFWRLGARSSGAAGLFMGGEPWRATDLRLIGHDPFKFSILPPGFGSG